MEMINISQTKLNKIQQKLTTPMASELQQTDHPLVKCTKLPEFWRMKKSLGEKFCIYFYNNFIQDGSKINIQAGNHKNPTAIMRNNESYVKNGIAEFLDLRFNSTSGRDTKFHVYIQVHSNPPLTVTYMNAIKISVDGPRPKRTNNKVKKIKATIDEQQSSPTSSESVSSSDDNNSSNNSNNSNSAASVSQEQQKGKKRRYDDCYNERSMKISDLIQNVNTLAVVNKQAKFAEKDFDIQNMLAQHQHQPHQLTNQHQNIVVASGLNKPTGGGLFSMHNLNLLVETALKATATQQHKRTSSSYSDSYSMLSPNSSSDYSDFSNISSVSTSLTKTAAVAAATALSLPINQQQQQKSLTSPTAFNYLNSKDTITLLELEAYQQQQRQLHQLEQYEQLARAQQKQQSIYASLYDMYAAHNIPASLFQNTALLNTQQQQLQQQQQPVVLLPPNWPPFYMIPLYSNELSIFQR